MTWKQIKTDMEFFYLSTDTVARIKYPSGDRDPPIENWVFRGPQRFSIKGVQLMTWGEFKEAVEAQGVKDDHEISYVDWSPGWGSDEPEAANHGYSDARKFYWGIS